MAMVVTRHAVIQCSQTRSPSGRFAQGPWSGPFGHSPATSTESGPTLYINTEGQCYGDLDMGSAESALAKDASPDREFDTSVSSSEEPRDNHITDLATLMGIRPGEKGSAPVVKSRPLKDVHGNNNRTSNNKKLRQSNNLNQPRRMN